MKSGAQVVLRAALAIAMSCVLPTVAQPLVESGRLATSSPTRAREPDRGAAGLVPSVIVAAASSCPGNVTNTAESAIELAERSSNRFDYRGALEVLERALRSSPESPLLLAAYGSVYLKAEEPGRARGYLNRAVELDPDCSAAGLGQAEACLLEHNYADAEDWLNRTLSKHPSTNKVSSSAHVLLARLRLETGKQAQAEAEGTKALDDNPENPNALYMMAFIRATERKPGLVRLLARRAVEIDPNLAGARRLLSQYVNGWAGYQQKVEGAALQHFEKGKSLEEMGNVQDALLEYEAAAQSQPRYYRALIALAGLRLSQRDYNHAALAASRAAEADPDGAIANMELAYAQIGLAERARLNIGATDYSIRFDQQGPPGVNNKLLKLVFPDYDKLSDHGRFVLGRSVAALACFLPTLASAGARHYLLHLDQSISECPGFKDMRERTTFDGRYYASIRGVGGRIALSGVEYLDEASRGGFNAIAHEFAHQVHETAMGPEDLGSVHRLYEAAKSEGRALDYYAAANEFEYFAAGYEAFISSFKRPGASLTARHTRDELKGRDPGLYRLLTKMADKSVQAGTD